jgi:hypothetical protein
MSPVLLFLFDMIVVHRFSAVWIIKRSSSAIEEDSTLRETYAVGVLSQLIR